MATGLRAAAATVESVAALTVVSTVPVVAMVVLACPACGGRLEVIAFIAEQGVARRTLDHLGMASLAPPLARARAPEDADPGPDYHGGDPAYED